MSNETKPGLLIGHLCKDSNTPEGGLPYEEIGGSVFYAWTVLYNFGVQTIIISPLGNDFPRNELPYAQIEEIENRSLFTLVYHNLALGDGERKQIVENADTALLPAVDKIKNKIAEASFCLLAPLLPNMPSGIIKQLRLAYPETLITFLPQGMYRKIGETGIVSKQKWAYVSEDISNVSVIIFSEKDMENAADQANEWSKMGPLAVVTRDKDGCDIYVRGGNEVIHVPAFTIEDKDIVDSTGCGDIFAAAFTFAYQKTGYAVKSAHFANAAAALSLRFLPNQLKYTDKDTEEFGDSQGRDVRL